jgi:hypothetical protein
MKKQEPISTFSSVLICLGIVIGSFVLMGIVCFVLHWSGVDNTVYPPFLN